MTVATPNWLASRRALVVGATPAADAVAAALQAAGAVVARADPHLADAPEIADAYAAAEANLGGGVDILVHGGVTIPDQAAETIDLATWRATHSADIDGRFLYAAEFTRRRLSARARGSILLLMPSARIAAGRTAAATADGALENLVKSLAVEWARDGVRTNAIASRVVEGFAEASPDQQASLGALAAYLVSDYAAYVTGCIMGVDEG